MLCYGSPSVVIYSRVMRNVLSSCSCASYGRNASDKLLVLVARAKQLRAFFAQHYKYITRVASCDPSHGQDAHNCYKKVYIIRLYSLLACF